MSDYMTSNTIGWHFIEMSKTTANGFVNNPKKTWSHVIRVKETVEVYEFGESMLPAFIIVGSRYDLFMATHFCFHCSLVFFFYLPYLNLNISSVPFASWNIHKIHFRCQSNLFHMQNEHQQQQQKNTLKICFIWNHFRYTMNNGFLCIQRCATLKCDNWIISIKTHRNWQGKETARVRKKHTNKKTSVPWKKNWSEGTNNDRKKTLQFTVNAVLFSPSKFRMEMEMEYNTKRNNIYLPHTLFVCISSPNTMTVL